MSDKRLKEMEEEFQELMIGSAGIHTEEIKELGVKIDEHKEFLESQKIGTYIKERHFKL